MAPLKDEELEPLLPELVDPVGETDQRIGPLSAKYTLVEYADFECPNCSQGFYIVKELLRDLEDDLCFVYRHYPQTDIHPNAQIAAEAAEAAGAQAKFWLMHDRLFEHQAELSPAVIRKLAEDLPLDIHRFQEDLDSGEPQRRVLAEKETGGRSGVDATPTFFVNGHMKVGSYEYDSLRKALEETPPLGMEPTGRRSG
jgi:formate-nitrite transporter family protein